MTQTSGSNIISAYIPLVRTQLCGHIIIRIQIHRPHSFAKELGDTVYVGVKEKQWILVTSLFLNHKHLPIVYVSMNIKETV